jgi:hypothetical protein
MINANIKKVVTDAIATETKAERKWLDVGAAVRAEYASEAALNEVRAEFLDTVIYPAMGDEALRVIRAEVPRKGSEAWRQSTPAVQQTYLNLIEAKKTVRGKGSVYFGRVTKYAFPSEAESEPAAKRDLKTRLNEELSALIKACQKSEGETFDVGMVVGHLESALKYINK